MSRTGGAPTEVRRGTAALGDAGKPEPLLDPGHFTLAAVFDADTAVEGRGAEGEVVIEV
ncbi:hypothetical protein QMZ92_05915 [Streptomyces sp. HNM0645]|uniref:hypothetical protein n=1 Tax=Streptomyces sp. HNM0645 TaxID=2782343 RepID=UPI0024B77C4E|nr:hypothetical protein [Streptomyces sp. HNM0645]MDI9883942.1 hypothetical protein [Streptomyces sp. HNM0645]